MKTIEERAYEHYPIKRVGLPEEIAASEEGWEGYIKGATEQEAITKREMIEKACEWLIENLGDYVSEGGWDVPWALAGYRYTEVVAEDFRKAMRGEI